MNISTEIAIKLIKEQFPKYKELKVKPVERNGHDNRTFHLGDDMTIRIPSNSCYVPQVEKESRWLTVFSQKLNFTYYDTDRKRKTYKLLSISLVY